jgi:hypothetical protein
MATLAQLRDRVLAKTGQPNDGALDPALAAVVDEAINASLEALAVDAPWLTWRRKVSATLAQGLAYLHLPAGMRSPGLRRILARTASLSWAIAGVIDEVQASDDAQGLPQRWEIAHGNSIASVAVTNGGSAGAVAGMVLDATTSTLVGGISPVVTVATASGGAILTVSVDEPGFGLPASTTVLAPEVTGADLTVTLEEIQAIRFDCPAATDITLTMEYDLSVDRLTADADECPIDAELVALVAAAQVAVTNEWPGSVDIKAMAARRLSKLRAANSPGFTGSMTPPQAARVTRFNGRIR